MQIAHVYHHVTFKLMDYHINLFGISHQIINKNVEMKLNV